MKTPKIRKDRERLLLNMVAARLLIVVCEMQEQSISEISREVGTTPAHASRIVKRMKRTELVRLRKSGRVKFVIPTPEGREAERALKVLSPWRPKSRFGDKVTTWECRACGRPNGREQIKCAGCGCDHTEEAVAAYRARRGARARLTMGEAEYREALIRLGEAFRESAKVLEKTGKVPQLQIEGGPDAYKFMTVAIAEILRLNQEAAKEIVVLREQLKNPLCERPGCELPARFTAIHQGNVVFACSMLHIPLGIKSESVCQNLPDYERALAASRETKR